MDTYVVLRILLNVFEIMACTAAFVCWSKIKNTYWKYFAFYLLFIVIVELSMEYIGYIKDNVKLNAAVYNFAVIPIQFVFFYWIFFNWLTEKKNKKLIILGLLIYLFVFFADKLYFDRVQFWFSSLSYMVGNIILLTLIIIFFIEFFN